MNDRTGNQVREEGDEQRVADEVLALCLALLQVDQVADLRKRKERDPQRKDDIPEVVPGDAMRVQEVEKRKEVFEVGERRQIEDDPAINQSRFPLRGWSGQCIAR